MTKSTSRRLGSWQHLVLLLLGLTGLASRVDYSFAQLSLPQTRDSRENSSVLNSLTYPVTLPSGDCVTIPPDAAFASSMLGRDQNGAIERRVALVIGNGTYKKIIDSSTERILPNPPGDAASVARALHALGFTVIAGVNLNKAVSEKCLSMLYEASDGAKAALLYFAGHGMSAGGNTYLLPIDAHVDTHTGQASNFLRVNGDKGILQQLRQKTPSFLFLDACRNIPFDAKYPLKEIDGESISGGDVRRGLVPLRDSNGGVAGLKDFYYAYATFPGETASDDVDANGHSPFASAFLRHVAEPGRDVPRLLLEMSFDVSAATSGAQLPWGEGAIKATSDLYFNGTRTLEEMIKESDQLAGESDNLRIRGQRVHAIETALRGVPLGNSTDLTLHFGRAMASLYRAVQSKEVVTEDSPTSCASVVAFSPDAKSVLTVIRGKHGKDCGRNLPDADAPKIWDTATGRLIRKFDFSELPIDVQFEQVLDARFSADGQGVILAVLPSRTSSEHREPLSGMSPQYIGPRFELWNPATGKFVRSLPNASDDSMSIRTFNENTVVMSCKTEGCARVDVSDIRNGKLRSSFPQLLEPVVRLTTQATDGEGHPLHDRIKTTALSSDGRFFFAISEGNGLGGVWDLYTGSLKCAIDVSHAAIPDHLYFDASSIREIDASFDKDAHRVAFTRDNQTVRIYDVDKCKEIRVITQNARSFLININISPDGRSLFTAQTNFQARLWSVSTGELLRTFVGHTDWVGESAYTNDSKLLATASDDGSVRIWNVDRNEAAHTIWPTPGFITEAKFSHNGKKISTVSDGLLFPDETVPSAQIWTAADFSPRTLENWRSAKIASVEFSGNDRWILGTTRSDVSPRLFIWDAKTLAEMPGIQNPDHFSAATFGPDDTSLAIARDGKIELWIPEGSGMKLANIYQLPNSQTDSISINGGRPYSTSDTERVVFSGTGREIAIIDGSISVLSFPQLKKIVQLQLPDASYMDARFDPSGEQVLGISRLGTGLWDVKTGRQLHSYMSSDGEQVLAAAFSPDGERVATASWSDGATIRLWSTQSGELLARQASDITARTGYIRVLNDQGVIDGLEWATWSVSFNTDGSRVISAAGDGAARIWDVGPYGNDLIKAAEAVLSQSGASTPVPDRMVFWEIFPK